MKKFILLLVSLMFLSTFTACFKDKDGEYKPKEKISKIYYDYGEGKELEEVWKWNGKQLQRIDHYYDGDLEWSEEFTYNKKGQIERVDCYEDSEYTEYTYDGNRMTKSTFYDSGTIEEEYNFTYDGNKVSMIEIIYFSKSSIEKSRLREEGHNPIKMLLQENYEIVKNVLNNTAMRNSVTLKVEWNKNNVSNIEVQDGGETEQFEFKYDDKLNPFKNYYDLYTFYDGEIDVVVTAYSKNNITEIRATYREDGETETEILKYSYSYDGKFPTVRRFTYSYERPIWDDSYDNIIDYETETETTSTYYEYE